MKRIDDRWIHVQAALTRNGSPQLWKSIDEFAKWIHKNCTSCRFLECDPPNLDPNNPCPLPRVALRALKRLEPIPKTIVKIACRPSDYANPLICPVAPSKCWSRKDKRGRRRKEIKSW